MTTALHLDVSGTVVGTPRAVPSKPGAAAGRERIMQRIASGDVTAMAELYDEHSTYVFGLALRIARDRGLAEDIVQDTFLGVWRNASRFDPARGSARTWILGIAHNRAIDLIRRRSATTVFLGAEDGARELLPPGPDVWPEVGARHDQHLVGRALACLPEAQRRSLELAYFGGLTQQEIAQVTGASLGTVKGRVRLALKRLRQLLAADFADDFVNASKPA